MRPHRSFLGRLLSAAALLPPPREKQSWAGGGDNDHAYFLPRLCGQRWGRGGQGEGAGRPGPMAGNRSGPRRGRAGAPRSRPRPRRPALLRLPGLAAAASAHSAALWGWGGGSPAENPPWGWRGGRKREGKGGGDLGKGGLGRTRAWHERGPREASWVKSGRTAQGRAQRGAGVRGQSPGAPLTGPHY